MMANMLTGRRVLVVEDEAVIAMVIADALEELGCVVVGPIPKLSSALELARDEAIDAAVLDVTIRGGEVYPVAEALDDRRIPFVLASGYGNWALPPKFRDRPRLTKPFSQFELEEKIRLLLAVAD